MLINLPKAESTTFGTNSLAFKGSLIWNTLPNFIKSSPTQSIFLKGIKTWNGGKLHMQTMQIRDEIKI